MDCNWPISKRWVFQRFQLRFIFYLKSTFNKNKKIHRGKCPLCMHVLSMSFQQKITFVTHLDIQLWLLLDKRRIRRGRSFIFDFGLDSL